MNFVGFELHPGHFFNISLGFFLFVSVYVCVCIFLMSLPPPNPPVFVTMFFFLLEIEGGGKDVGSHLKCMSFCSLNFFWLSAIKRLIVWVHFWLE